MTSARSHPIRRPLTLLIALLLPGCVTLPETTRPAVSTQPAPPQSARPGARQPLSVLVIVDRSSPALFPQAVEVARTVLAELPAGSSFGVLAADNRSGQDGDVLLPPTRLGLRGRGLQLMREKKELDQTLRSLRTPTNPPRGSALLSALRHAAWLYDREEVMPRLILLPSDMRPDSPIPDDRRSYDQLLADELGRAPFHFRNTSLRCLFVNRHTSSDSSDLAWDRITDLWIRTLRSTGLDLDKRHFLQPAELQTAHGTLDRRKVQELVWEVQAVAG